MGILYRLTRSLWLSIFLFVLVAPASAQVAQCEPGRVDLRGDWGAVRLSTELALTPADQARGLMFREELPRLASMLFIYEDERPLAFWMRNTLIPLDIIFLDASGTVIRVHERAQPLDETRIPSGEPALAVLEVNGGLAARLGIEPGDTLRSPAMPQDVAAWSCG